MEVEPLLCIQAEQAAFACALVSIDARQTILRTLEARDFFLAKHESIFKGLTVSLPEDIEGVVRLSTGVAFPDAELYISELMALVGDEVQIANASYYACIVKHYARWHQIYRSD